MAWKGREMFSLLALFLPIFFTFQGTTLGQAFMRFSTMMSKNASPADSRTKIGQPRHTGLQSEYVSVQIVFGDHFQLFLALLVVKDYRERGFRSGFLILNSAAFLGTAYCLALIGGKAWYGAQSFNMALIFSFFGVKEYRRRCCRGWSSIFAPFKLGVFQAKITSILSDFWLYSDFSSDMWSWTKK